MIIKKYINNNKNYSLTTKANKYTIVLSILWVYFFIIKGLHRFEVIVVYDIWLVYKKYWELTIDLK